jgi:hypothetical protein
MGLSSCLWRVGVARRSLLCWLWVVIVLGCGGTTITENSSDAMVSGRVSDPQNGPVRGANVLGEVFDSAGTLQVENATVTDSLGHYDLFLSGFLMPPLSGRLRLTITPPAGAALRAATVDSLAIRLGAEPLESITVDVILMASDG